MGISYPASTIDPSDFGHVPGDGALRVGGVAVGPTPTLLRGVDLPSYMTPAVEAQQEALHLVRDLWDGTERVRRKGQQYLPREPGEDLANYGVRLRRSVFFNVFRHTIEGLAGFIFRKDPVLGSDVPEIMKTHWENIDNAGTHGDVFTRALLTDAMMTGHAGILVEYPDTGTQVLTIADEYAMGVRPYWVAIRKDDIISVRTVIERGCEILTQMVLRETAYVEEGAYGVALRTCYRVLTHDPVLQTAAWRLETLTADQKQVVVLDAGQFVNQEQIPVVEVPTAGRLGAWQSRPQFLDLAYLNVAHYQQWSDYATCIHKTNVPILVTSGVEVEGGLIIGPNAGLNFSAPDAKAYYVAHDGHALASSKASLDDLKNDMAALGLAALANSKRIAETAVAKTIDKSASDAVLSVTARGVQDATERALYFHARYLKLPEGGSLQFNREFGDTRIHAADVLAWIALAEKLNVPLMAVLSAMRTGGWIPDDADLEELAAEALQNGADKAAAAAAIAAAGTALVTAAGPKGAPAPPPVAADAGQDPATTSSHV